KLVVSVCVLAFFWGVFALLAGASGRGQWFLAPCIAMLAYRYTFKLGFFNYYLSLAVAARNLALLSKGQGMPGADGSAWGAVVVPLVLLAHPLGLAWLAGAAIYLVVWTKLPGWWKLTMPAMAVAGLVAVHWYLMHRVPYPINWRDAPFYAFSGADQLVLYD